MLTPRLNDKVLRNLGLPTQPFRLPEDCEELFKNTSTDMLINSITNQLSSNNLIQLVIGEKYSGKSCFCRRLLCEAPSKLLIKYYTVDSKPRIDDLFVTLLDKQHCNTGNIDTHELAAEAAKNVFRILRNEQQPVLLIDNAHRLPSSVLRMLFRFLDAISKQNRGSLKVVLVGERELEEKWHTLHKAAPPDETICTSLLRPLSRQDLASFLTFRFEYAGVSNHPFNKKQLQIIQQESGGLPGRIEQFACKILNSGQYGIKKFFSVKLMAIASCIAAIPLLTGIYFFWPTDQKTAAGYPLRPEPVNPLTTSELNTSTAEPLGESTLTQDGHVNTQPITAKTNPELVIDTEETGGAKYQTTSPSYTLRDSNWLRQWPDDYYVVQLSGSWQKESLLNAVAAVELENELIFHTSLRNNKVWYVLLYGVFPDRAAASEAILKLPMELRKSQPWPRPIGTLVSN